jgi:hypothetical protein
MKIKESDIAEAVKSSTEVEELEIKPYQINRLKREILRLMIKKNQRRRKKRKKEKSLMLN